MNKSGFTFVELIVILAILGILGVASFSVYTVWQSKSNVSLGRSVLIQALSEAKQQSISGKNDKNWGIKYISGKVILFSGSNYLLRDVNQDKIFDLPSGVTITGLDEFIFNKFSGLPINTATINVFYGNENEQINISSQGVFNN